MILRLRTEWACIALVIEILWTMTVVLSAIYYQASDYDSGHSYSEPGSYAEAYADEDKIDILAKAGDGVAHGWGLMYRYPVISANGTHNIDFELYYEGSIDKTYDDDVALLYFYVKLWDETTEEVIWTDSMTIDDEGSYASPKGFQTAKTLYTNHVYRFEFYARTTAVSRDHEGYCAKADFKSASYDVDWLYLEVVVQ